MIGIYAIKNKVNNKMYIGKSVNINDRLKRHKKEIKLKIHKNKHLQSAWYFYGEDNFEILILERCKKDLLNQKEIFWIEFYDSFNNGYNKTKGGDGGAMHPDIAKMVGEHNKGNKYHLGMSHSKETKKLLSKIATADLLERWKNEEYYSKMSNMSKELWKSQEYRDKQSTIRRKLDNETIFSIYLDTKNNNSNKELAKKYNVSPTMICNIRYKQSWYGEVIEKLTSE